jgi:hypothetical protein
MVIISMYVCMYLSISIYLSIYHSIYLSIYHSIYLSIILSIYHSIYLSIILSIYLSFYLSIQFYNSCRPLPQTKRHPSPFLHWSCSKSLSVMAACTPPIHVCLCPLLRLSSGTHPKINFGIFSSGILLTWPYHCSIFFSMIFFFFLFKKKNILD